MLQNPQHGGADEFLVGEAASLDPLRLVISTGNEEAISVALKQLLDDEERILVSRTPVVVTISSENGDPQKSSVHGQLIVTSERILFVSDSPSNSTNPTNGKYDMSIGAECVHLHAQAADPVSVYVQLEGKDDESDPTEVSIIPAADEKAKICEAIFQNLTAMIASHPISPHGDEGGGGMMEMMMGMMMGQQSPSGIINGTTSTTNEQSASLSDDLIIAAPTPKATRTEVNNSQFSDCEEGEEQKDDDDDDPGATAEERAAMLARLDSILVVKPDLEIPGDQFADAEGDDELVGEEEDTGTGTKKDVEQPAPPPKAGGQFDDADDQDDPLL